MHITLVTTGDVVPLGRSIQAVTGPYAGMWWRLDDVRRSDGDTPHVVHVSRLTRIGRHRMVASPGMFGLVIREAVTLWRHVCHLLTVTRRKVDDGLILGALALIPLALFEAFHGGETTRALLTQWLSSGNGGGH